MLSLRLSILFLGKIYLFQFLRALIRALLLSPRKGIQIIKIFQVLGNTSGMLNMKVLSRNQLIPQDVHNILLTVLRVLRDYL